MSSFSLSSSITELGIPEQSQPRVSLRLLPWLFGCTLFLAASLLFLVQPLFARLVLPLLGGTPAVWNTCLVFFQAALLAGYLYSHLTTTYLPWRWQLMLHATLLLLAGLTLPLTPLSRSSPPTSGSPVGWLVLVLAGGVGFPFFALATTAPLLQRWFANTGHPSARDPYFLYAASNAGSLLALLGYPFLIEPNWTLAEQDKGWSLAYVLLGVSVFTCGLVGLLLSLHPARGLARRSNSTVAESVPSLSQQCRWVALGLIPSSLLLGVTTHLTTDVAAFPLLWVLPLALYLVTFLVAFTRLGERGHGMVVRLTPMIVILVTAKLFTHLGMPTGLEVALHLLAFFVLALMCHGELARTRPEPEYLTRFYLLLSLGGVLGGLLNTLVAPVAFNTGLEYHLVMVLACLLLPASEQHPFSSLVRRNNLFALVAVASLGLGCCLWWMYMDWNALASDFGEVSTFILRLAPALIPLSLCYASAERPVRLGLSIAALLSLSSILDDPTGAIRVRLRGFYGRLEVRYDAERNTHWLVHGTTLHGKQSLEPHLREEPLTYFHRRGPMGQIFGLPTSQRRRIGVLGLGMGSMACYARAGQEWTFYEIDPLVVRLAEDKRYFTCLADARRRGAQVQVILGDARLQIAHAPSENYDLLLFDSFSSDSVPLHLLSHEAFQLYTSKLAPAGVLVFNISNRYLNLEPVLARLGREEGFVALTRLDQSQLDVFPDKSPSRWVVLARDINILGDLQKKEWKPAQERANVELWRDDYANILRVLLWD